MRLTCGGVARACWTRGHGARSQPSCAARTHDVQPHQRLSRRRRLRRSTPTPKTPTTPPTSPSPHARPVSFSSLFAVPGIDDADLRAAIGNRPLPSRALYDAHAAPSDAAAAFALLGLDDEQRVSYLKLGECVIAMGAALAPAVELRLRVAHAAMLEDGHRLTCVRHRPWRDAHVVHAAALAARQAASRALADARRLAATTLLWQRRRRPKLRQARQSARRGERCASWATCRRGAAVRMAAAARARRCRPHMRVASRAGRSCSVAAAEAQATCGMPTATAAGSSSG